MARRTRCSDGVYVYHVLNGAVGRATLFRKTADYAAFETILQQGWERFGLRLLNYVIMPNHSHLVVWPHAERRLATQPVNRRRSQPWDWNPPCVPAAGRARRRKN